MNSHWTALNTTEFLYQIWSCPIFLLKPKRADWLMCFRLLRWIFMSLFWLVCRNLMGSYEFVLWWCASHPMSAHFKATVSRAEILQSYQSYTLASQSQKLNQIAYSTVLIKDCSISDLMGTFLGCLKNFGFYWGLKSQTHNFPTKGTAH